MIVRAVVLLFSFSLTSACAELTSIQHTFGSQTSHVSTIDAKQRVVSVLSNEASKNGKRQVCVEQSPDVFSFFSGSASLSVEEKEKIAAALAVAISESGGTLAFRTQVTQAQANLIYAICQLHANGAISDKAVRAEIRRFQNTLVGILAIEQLTAPYRGSAQQTILTTSSASAGKNVDVAQSNLKQAQEAQQEAEASLKKEKDALAGITEKNSESYETQTEKVEAAQKEVDNKKKAVSIAEEKLRAARLALEVSAGGQQAIINVVAPPSAGTPSDGVAEAVVRSLEIVLHRGVLIDSCVEATLEGDTEPEQYITKHCDNVFTAYLNAYKTNESAYAKQLVAKADAISALAGALKKETEASKPNTELEKGLIELLKELVNTPTIPPPPTKPANGPDTHSE